MSFRFARGMSPLCPFSGPINSTAYSHFVLPSDPHFVLAIVLHLILLLRELICSVPSVLSNLSFRWRILQVTGEIQNLIRTIKPRWQLGRKSLILLSKDRSYRSLLLLGTTALYSSSTFVYWGSPFYYRSNFFFCSPVVSYNTLYRLPPSSLLKSSSALRLQHCASLICECLAKQKTEFSIRPLGNGLLQSSPSSARRCSSAVLSLLSRVVRLMMLWWRCIGVCNWLAYVRLLACSNWMGLTCACVVPL